MSKSFLSNSRIQSDSISNFIQKTYQILQNKDNESIISWSQRGNSFVVKDILAFSNNILPKYFKHSNFSSFVRQLNMYNFHKVRGDKQENEFQHPKFKKGHRDLLVQIRRKGNQASTTTIPQVEKDRAQDKLENQKQKPGVAPSKQEVQENIEQEQMNNNLELLLNENRKLKRQKNKYSVLRKEMIDCESTIDDKFYKLITTMIAHKIKEKLSINKTLRNSEHHYPLQNFNSIVKHILSAEKPLSYEYYDVYSKIILEKSKDQGFMLGEEDEEQGEVIPSIEFIVTSQSKI